MQTVKTQADISTHDNTVVDVVGVYEIDDLGRRRVTATMPDGTVVQTNQMVYIKLEDGDLRVGARPDDERAELANKRVIARGKVLENPPRPPDHVSQMTPMPTLVDIQSIVSAD